MNRRVAVVTPTYGDSWREEDLVCRRVAGALATAADVDVLVATGGVDRVEHDGAVRVVRLPAFPVNVGRRRAVFRSLLGPTDESSFGSCGCLEARAHDIIDGLSARTQEEFVRAAGGDSPALWRRLEEEPYDIVVFAGYATASSVFGVRHVGRRARIVLLPLARQGLLLGMPVVAEPFERASCIVVSTESERAIVERQRVGDAPVWNTGFVLGVNMAVLAAPPHGFAEHHHNIVVPGDWRQADDYRWLNESARVVQAELGPEVRLRVVGPGAVRISQNAGEHLAGSRSDVWRWMSHAVGVFDPHVHRLLGRDVLESMMFGVPVIVPADGGASREHAQVGNGGLWYRIETEMIACVAALLDADIRRGLSEQGSDYATNDFTDTDRYIEAVVKAVLEEV